MVEKGTISRQENFATRKSTIDQHSEIIKGLDKFVGTKLDLLLPIDKIWQPSDVLPNLNSDGWQDELIEFRKQAENISDDLLIVLIGNTITEEALPNYTNWFGRFSAVRDNTGTDESSWAKWSRGWTGEENRHGEAMTALLRYSGRVDMRAVEKTIHYLLATGFNPQIKEDPYRALFYPTFQEPGTQISHRNTAKLARKQGSDYIYKTCGKTAGDEGRHAVFYGDIYGELFRIDPEGAVIAMRDMMRTGISMPAALMTEDGSVSPKRQSDLFEIFSKASIISGVYSPNDYVSVFESLMKRYKVENILLSGEAAKAQDDLGRMLLIHQRVAERNQPVQNTIKKYPWIYNRNDKPTNAVTLFKSL